MVNAFFKLGGEERLARLPLPHADRAGAVDVTFLPRAGVDSLVNVQRALRLNLMQRWGGPSGSRGRRAGEQAG